MKRNASYSVEPSIQFTLEREKDRHSPFFDLNVCRAEQGNLKTSVYRKPTHANKYLASDSHHSIRHKKSLKVLTQEGWLSNILDWFKAEERKDVSEVLKVNGYTNTFLRNCQKPVTVSNTNQRLVLLLFLTFRVLRSRI